jgi:uncharacterized protein (DUF849 family)
VAPPSNRPFIIVAPNGARRTKSDHSRLPITPSELAKTALECASAGAAMIHMHARKSDGSHSLEIDDNRATYEAVKEAVGGRMIVQMTTEAVGIYKPAQQMQLIYELRPEAASFGLRELIPDTSHEERAAEFFHWVADHGIIAQYILYSAADLEYYLDLCERELLPSYNHHLLLVLGRYSEGQQSSPTDLKPFVPLLLKIGNIRWAVCAFGRDELHCLIESARLGGDVRVGFENNLMGPDGELAVDNASQVQRLYRSMQSEKLSLLGADEVRQRLKKT